ncbi:hypothetical protein [Leptotrichia wadei]|nr:hypothetical protein [Leptotrichia wadei]
MKKLFVILTLAFISTNAFTETLYLKIVRKLDQKAIKYQKG